MNEKKILDTVNSMCEESLSPDEFEKWEQILFWLKKTRNII